MSQLILYVALHVLGVVVCMAIGPWQRISLCSALGFAIGLASMVVVSLATLILGVFHIGVVATLYAALLGVCIAGAVKRKRWSLRTVRAAGVGTLGFAILCFPFCYFNFSALSYDSHSFVMYGRIIGADGGLTVDMLERLTSWGVFQVVAHAMTSFVKQDYLYGLAPVFAVSMLATFAVVLTEALDHLRVARLHRVIWTCLVIAVLLAIPLFRFHTIYIHANMASAGYLSFFVMLFWLAEVEQDDTLVPVAFLSLLAFTLLRVEAVPYAIAFLVVTVMKTQLSRRALLPWYLLYTTVLVIWFSLLALSVPSDSIFLTPTKCLLFGAALSLLFLYWLVKDRGLFRHLTPYLSYLAVVACCLGIGFAYVTHGDTMRESASIWLDDLWTSPWWASIWKCAAVLALVGVFLPSPPLHMPLVLGMALFFGLTLIVSSTSTAFGPDIDGGLIRITIHIVPVVLFYGALKFAPLLTTARER